MANQKRVRFVSPDDSNPRLPHKRVSRANLHSLPAETSYDPSADIEDSQDSDSDPPASLLATAPIYIPSANDEPLLVTRSLPTTPAVESLAAVLAKQPAKAPESSEAERCTSRLPTLRWVFNLFGRHRRASESRPRSVSAPIPGRPSTATQPEEPRHPTQPIYIPGMEPTWEDEIEERYDGSLEPAPSHYTVGYAAVAPDLFTPEVVQRGFHVPPRQPESSSRHSPA